MTEDVRQLQNSSDAFEKVIADGTRNRIDIGSHYPYNPERLRVSVDGNRQFIQYSSISQYNHATDVHELIPGDGETVAIRTTERPRYVVQYEVDVTSAFSLSRELEAGDTFRWGLWDGTDGWYLEQTGSDASDEATFKIDRNGSVTDTDEVTLAKPLTDFNRFEIHTAWYQIARAILIQSYVDDLDEQQMRELGRVSPGNRQGPQVGNLPIRMELSRGSGNSAITLNAGSMAFVVLGDAEPITRDKTLPRTNSVSVTNTWEPVRAFRIDPARDIVNVQVGGFSLRETTTSADSFIQFQVFDPQKVADSGGNQLEDSDFSVPDETQGQNSVIEESTAVDQVADGTGTLQTSMTDPGGYQLRQSELYTGTGQNEVGAEGALATTKRELPGQDIGVILVKSGSTGTISYTVRFEQDW